MIQINKESVISEVEHADTTLEFKGWKAVVAEVVTADGVEGTLLYFPGVVYKDLL